MPGADSDPSRPAQFPARVEMIFPVPTVTRRLVSAERPALLAHLFALDAADRRSRFGIAVSDDFLRDYTTAIDFRSDAVFGVFDAELALVGAAHLALVAGHAELGVSVLPQARDRGIGAALLARAHLHARNRGVAALFLRCLRENAAMMHLARSQNMRIATESGESDACLTLTPPNPFTFTAELLAEQAGLYDHGLKAHVLAVRGVAAAWAKAGMAA